MLVSFFLGKFLGFILYPQNLFKLSCSEHSIMYQACWLPQLRVLVRNFLHIYEDYMVTTNCLKAYGQFQNVYNKENTQKLVK